MRLGRAPLLRVACDNVHELRVGCAEHCSADILGYVLHLPAGGDVEDEVDFKSGSAVP